MGRRVLSLVLLITFLWSGLVFGAAKQPDVEAEAAILMVADTKEILFDKNSKGIMYPASTTKIMTLITALEKGNPNSVVTVSPKAAACEESRLELNAGDKLTLNEAMTGMMLVSGNDAAEAIAENVGGSIPKFVYMMNQMADKIGVENTHFTNPHGLPDPINHYTTAYDLALITAYGMKIPSFEKIVSTPTYEVKFLNRDSIYATNTNKLLKTYPGMNGVKTGYTNDAGECLVASAKRGNVELIAVILNSDYRWRDATKLLDYGFAQLGL
ncbi:D-alanyl-D-alanine carboxypeptidase family protein [Pelosinus sp. UFO1]|uniref:D-alanyl-D-alanine carboxypeptidase family protein n=1 Tax=Pelosinus sp. UFO1 TaxID=484770 RepID=UPI0004D0CBB4|nr:D-alanyl-D-alanine carboxypeptidase family protein [Pelosinus sp. UFO1]AIF54290.1 Serine-type D-Ala-D-Ala carboxypeptidase [Pelosinus sp. UFO1]